VYVYTEARTVITTRWTKTVQNKVSKCVHIQEKDIHVVEQVRPQGIKENGQNNEIRHKNKNCRKTLPDNTVQYPESDTSWKIQLSLSNRRNRHTPTSAIIRQRNSQLNIRWTSTHC